MPDFSIPLSGLTAESTALSAIANNLSNQNTTGYKDTKCCSATCSTRVWEPRGREIRFRWEPAWRLVPCLRIVHARQRQCDGRAHGCGHPRQRIFRGAERERHHRLHAGGRFFGRLQQLPGHFRRTTGAGLSRGERSGQHRSGNRAAAAGRRDHQSADGNGQRAS
jgi:hypothetical protein